MTPTSEGPSNAGQTGDSARRNAERRRLRRSLSPPHVVGRAALWQWALHAVADSILMLDEHGHICDAEHEVRSPLFEHGCLAVRGGRLVATGSPGNVQRFERALRSTTDASPVAIALLTRRGHLALRVRVIRVPRHLRAQNSDVAIAYVLMLDVPASQSEVAAQVARANFELTAAETRVIRGLLAGCGPKKIAASLGIGIATVRSHLSRIYSKTRAANQRELLARLMS